MVIDDFDIECVSFRPAETNPPLVIDADAVLAVAVTRSDISQHLTPSTTLAGTMLGNVALYIS